MFCQAVRRLAFQLRPLPLSNNHPSCQLHVALILQSRSKGRFNTCHLCDGRGRKFLVRNAKSISSALRLQRFSTSINQNQHDMAANNLEEDNSNRRSDEKGTPVIRINGSVLFGDFRQKLLSGRIAVMSSDDWSCLEIGLLEENPRLKYSWEAMCMAFIKSVKSIPLASSLENYIREQGRTLNIATQTIQISLIGECGGPERHQKVLDLYNKLMEQTNGILDAYSLKNVMKGLCGTDHWKESLRLVEMLEPFNPSLNKYFTPMVLAALRNGEELTALKLLDQLGGANGTPEPEIYAAFLESCMNSKHLNIEALLNLMGKYRWFPSRETMIEIVKHMKRNGNPDRWVESWIRINKNGVCPSCKESLSKIELSNREFSKLQSIVLEKTLIGDDIYQRSNPHELRRFKSFVKEHAPFDVVIDSLNVVGKIIQLSKSYKLRKVVEYFVKERKMKVLVIGREHMVKWDATDMKAITDNAKCFFLENITEDDPYLLYATMYSGRKAMFVSSDEMRDHKFLLGEKLGEIFMKWQRGRQIQFLNITRKGRVVLEWPRRENVKAQFNSSWHIPYDNEDKRPSWQDPFSWVCLKKSTPNFGAQYRYPSSRGR